MSRIAALPKPRPVDYHPILPSRRRISWEALEDIQVINSRLLILIVLLGTALVVESLVLLTIYKRPPDILSQNDGYVMWRTTETYRLRKDILRAYLEDVLGKLFTIHPGSYDLSRLTDWVEPKVLNAFNGNAQKGAQLRIRLDRRQIYSLYELKRYHDPRYPKLLTLLARGEQTTYEEQKDDTGNVRVIPNSEIVLHTVYLKQVRPTPNNPWGLVLAGIGNPGSQEASAVLWDKGTELPDHL